MSAPLLWRSPHGQVALDRDSNLYHGGRKGLSVGTVLLPGNRSGSKGWMQPEDFLPLSPQRNYVYVTPWLKLAMGYAAGPLFDREGSVYRVLPLGKFEPDPILPEAQFMAEKAQILEVIPFVPLTLTELMAINNMFLDAKIKRTRATIAALKAIETTQ